MRGVITDPSGGASDATVTTSHGGTDRHGQIERPWSIHEELDFAPLIWRSLFFRRELLVPGQFAEFVLSTGIVTFRRNKR